MKKTTTLLIAVIITAITWAQSPQKMSYQAVIRGASNALITNTVVGMQISILQTTNTGTAVYVETQTPTTNANGLVSIEIGAGTPVTGTFAGIDWSAGPYFIKTETDPAGGITYTITGTSQLLSVPYALSAGNVTGLEKITEGTNTGWRLVGQNPANYGDIGINAVDLSESNIASIVNGATADNSTAMGRNTIASGIFSTALGNNTVASGTYAVAMGNNTTANALASTAIGRYNIGGGSTFSWISADPLFEIGNGTSATRSNALTVLKNGNVGIGTSTPSHKLEVVGGNIQLGAGHGLRILNTAAFYTELITNGTQTNLTNFSGGNISLRTSAFGGGIPTDKLVVSSNGNVGIGTNAPSSKLDVNGVFRATGNVWPSTGAGVEIAYDATLGTGYVQTYDRTTALWKDLALGALNVRPISDNFTSLGTSTNKWTAVYAVNGTIQTSDRRMKKDIKDLNYGLNTVLQLRPVSYKWKKGNQDLNLGLIAQEVQKVLPEIVDVGTDKDKTLGMNYSELIPVLIKGMQEQQQEINELKKLVNKLLQKKIVARN